MLIEARENLRVRTYDVPDFVTLNNHHLLYISPLSYPTPSPEMRPTQALFRRIRNFQLTTKQGPKDYYKGTGSGRMGDHTKYGGYIVNYDRVRTYCVPQNLDSFKVCRHIPNRSRS